LAGGHRVTALSRTGSGPDGCYCLSADVTDHASLHDALTRSARERGAARVLALCSGQMAVRPLLLTDDALFERTLSVNVVGAFRALSAVLPHMVRGGDGRVILLSSLSGLWGSAGQVAYATAKGALIGLAQGAAVEVGRFGVTVNVVVPGFVETPMTAQLTGSARQALVAAAPLGRAVRADEVADAVEFLTHAPAVNGAVLLVDGGQHAMGAAGWRSAS
jgi:3-oxoacyl-[acyl-carrier protein] reductase